MNRCKYIQPIRQQLRFGVDLQKLYPPWYLHPSLKNLLYLVQINASDNDDFNQFTESILGKGLYGQGITREILLLKDRLVSCRDIFSLRVSPSVPIWLLRHFLGLLPDPIFTANGDRHHWLNLSDQCRNFLMERNRSKTDSTTLRDIIAKEIASLRAQNLTLLFEFFELLHFLATSLTFKNKTDKRAVDLLAYYFSASLFVRPYRPGIIRNEDKKYFPLITYIIYHWQELSSRCQHVIGLGEAKNLNKFYYLYGYHDEVYFSDATVYLTDKTTQTDEEPDKNNDSLDKQQKQIYTSVLDKYHSTFLNDIEKVLSTPSIIDENEEEKDILPSTSINEASSISNLSYIKYNNDASVNTEGLYNNLKVQKTQCNDLNEANQNFNLVLNLNLPKMVNLTESIDKSKTNPAERCSLIKEDNIVNVTNREVTDNTVCYDINLLKSQSMNKEQISKVEENIPSHDNSKLTDNVKLLEQSVKSLNKDNKISVSKSVSILEGNINAATNSAAKSNLNSSTKNNKNKFDIRTKKKPAFYSYDDFKTELELYIAEKSYKRAEEAAEPNEIEEDLATLPNSTLIDTNVKSDPNTTLVLNIDIAENFNGNLNQATTDETLTSTFLSKTSLPRYNSSKLKANSTKSKIKYIPQSNKTQNTSNYKKYCRSNSHQNVVNSKKYINNKNHQYSSLDNSAEMKSEHSYFVLKDEIFSKNSQIIIFEIKCDRLSCKRKRTFRRKCLKINRIRNHKPISRLNNNNTFENANKEKDGSCDIEHDKNIEENKKEYFTEFSIQKLNNSKWLPNLSKQEDNYIYDTFIGSYKDEQLMFDKTTEDLEGPQINVKDKSCICTCTCKLHNSSENSTVRKHQSTVDSYKFCFDGASESEDHITTHFESSNAKKNHVSDSFKKIKSTISYLKSFSPVKLKPKRSRSYEHINTNIKYKKLPRTHHSL